MAKKKTTKPPGKKPAKAATQRQIEKLDRQIAALINERADLSARCQQRSAGPGSSPATVDRKVLADVVDRNKGPLSDESVLAVFRELLSGSQAIGAVARVSYLGPEYTYSHLAAIERFGQSAELMPVGTIAAVFEEVEHGNADFGIVPIENSTDGRVADALDCLARSPLKISGEVPLRIRHCLLGRSERKDVRRVVSKAQPLSQCRNWLSTHLPGADLIEAASTAEAAQRAMSETGTAAIASHQAGVNCSLPVLARNIEDNPDNVTRFAVVGAESGPQTGNDKTSLVCEISHEPGALADMMGIFKRQRLNMTWIESFPMRGQRGRYLFFVEFQGHAGELRARRALASLEKKAVRLTVLGSYAQADPIG